MWLQNMLQVLRVTFRFNAMLLSAVLLDLGFNSGKIPLISVICFLSQFDLFTKTFSAS